MAQPLWKIVWHFLIQLNLCLLYSPAVAFLGIYPREMKIDVHINTYTPTFVASVQQYLAALFTRAPNWKQPKYSSAGKWLNRLCCIPMG